MSKRHEFSIEGNFKSGPIENRISNLFGYLGRVFGKEKERGFYEVLLPFVISRQELLSEVVSATRETVGRCLKDVGITVSREGQTKIFSVPISFGENDTLDFLVNKYARNRGPAGKPIFSLK